MVTLKNDNQIALMRESCRIVKETLDFVGKNIRAGMTTKQVDELVYRYITSCGAYPSELGYQGYPASSCVSVNEVVVHGIPSDRVILDGDIVSVDITAEKNGYHGDACRTFLIGNVSEDKKRLVKVTEECFSRLWKAYAKARRFSISDTQFRPMRKRTVTASCARLPVTV